MTLCFILHPSDFLCTFWTILRCKRSVVMNQSCTEDSAENVKMTKDYAFFNESGKQKKLTLVGLQLKKGIFLFTDTGYVADMASRKVHTSNHKLKKRVQGQFLIRAPLSAWMSVSHVVQHLLANAPRMSDAYEILHKNRVHSASFQLSTVKCQRELET